MFWGWKKPKNQCEWRPRKIFAFSLQPFLVFGFYLPVRTCYAVFKTIFCLLIGFYPNKIGWKAIIHPFNMDCSDIADKEDLKDGRNYWWITKSDRKERSRLEKIFMSPITAYSLAIVFLIAVALNLFYFASIIRFLEWDVLLACLLFSVLAMGSVLVLYWISMFILDCFFSKILEKRAQELRDRKWAAEEERIKEEKRLFQSSLSFFYEQRLQPLACTQRPREATLASLPESHRTMWLRFMDIKVKACKPFRN